MKRLLLFVICMCTLGAKTQEVFTQQQFFDVVKGYHPVARQAALQADMARADITSAHSGFDPYVQSDIARKEFKGTEYYNHRLHQLQIPAWFGVNLNAGLEALAGERTNPEDTKGSTSFVGLSVPLANGLLMDSRRATLQQARIYQRASLEEQRIMLNDLLLDAGKAYWNWWQQWETYRLFEAAAANASQRFRLIKTAYEIGERPAIDTLEALAQLQSFKVQQSEIAQELANARLELSLYLWQAGGQPYELPASVVPAAPAAPALAYAEGNINEIGNHPLLRQYGFKIDALQVERRLKFQYLLPYVTFKYNQLVDGHSVGDAFKAPLFQNNFKYGLSFALPLRLSEGRGEYRKARLKIASAEWERINKQVQLETKLRQYRNDWQQLVRQEQLQATSVQQYAALQRAEEVRFSGGESSLFLINSREIKTIEARQKLIDLQAKQQKAMLSIRWAAGVLAN